VFSSTERGEPILSAGGLGIHMLGVGGMQLSQITKTGILASSLLLSFWIGPLYAQSTDDKTKPDNTSVNKRDQNPGEATADQQKMNAADRALTAKIRKAVIADKSLSTYAHNVKIISQNGTVTLKGPVHSDDEVTSIMAKATEVAGSPDKVVNQLSVKP
jgi:hyperosmotically inducible protein